MSVKELIEKINSEDDNVRGDAWQGAGSAGPEAILPLAEVFGEGKFKISRAAMRAMWKIVRHVGRPDGPESERKAVVRNLIKLLDDSPDPVRREVLWMLSEICGDEAVGPIKALLENEVLREDTRMALERIPGEASLAALKAGFQAAPEDFKQNIVQSLRARGEKVEGYPCQKLVPKKKTNVKPVGRE